MELLERIKSGAVQIFSEEGLKTRLEAGKPLTIKLGADPSRPDLHLGHSVVLRKLKLFQDQGHKIVFVIGDFTAMIGDPSGRNKTRPALTLEETRAGGESYFKQVTKILDPKKTEITYNSQWLSKMNFQDVVGLCAKYTVARILERDDFKNRLEKNLPISMHELLYPLMQGYDSVALRADVEVGGTDQTFNLLVGRALQTDFGQAPQEVITFPLLVGLDGKEKMSKSLDNYIGIDEPAEVMFEKAMKVPDPLLLDYYILTTDVLAKDAEEMVNGDIREAHMDYATRIVTMYHDAEAAEHAKRRYFKVAGGEVPEALPEYIVEGSQIQLVELMRRVGFSASNGEARRGILGKGVKIDGETVADIAMIVNLDAPLVLQFGKNRFVKVRRG